MKSFLICTAGLFLLGTASLTFADKTKPEKPKRMWFCQATDYQGGFGSGSGQTRGEAEADAITKCQARSRGVCVISGCFER